MTNEQKQQDFEAWAQSEGYYTGRVEFKEGWVYANDTTDKLSKAYQAAAARYAPKEVIASVDIPAGKYGPNDEMAEQINFQHIPDGYVIAPVEPTEAMVWAGIGALPDGATECYRAMISAYKREGA